MPPKRAKTTNGDGGIMEGTKDNGDVTTEGTRKAQPRVKPHEALVLLIDVGRSSAEQSVPTEKETDLDRSIQIADWLLSRKIFTESTDRFSLMFFGHESTSNDNHPNIYVHNEEFEKARVEWLHVLQNEIETNPKCVGDYVDALYSALESLKIYIEGQSAAKAVIGSTITLVSNLSGLNGQTTKQHIDFLAAGFKALGTDLCIVGPNLLEEPLSKSQKVGYDFAKQLLTKVGGSVYNFRESLSKLKLFIPKAIQIRGQQFNLELGTDFSIRVQLYLKNDDKPPLSLKFDPVGKNGGQVDDGMQQPQELKKIRRYETISDEVSAIKYGQIDQASDATFANMGQMASAISSGRFIGKEQITRGFLYGTTLVPFSEEVLSMVEYPHEGKQLQLMQFVRKENLLPQFIMTNCRYILPAQGDQTAHTTMSALCQAMIEMGVIALCRYAYNIQSNPRMACLIPKISKETNYPVFIHYVMPFRDDFRYFDFPPVRAPIKDYQLALMDGYIDALMLYDENSKKEQLKKNEMHDPRVQYECQLLRDKALHPEKKGMELSAEDRQRLLESLSAPNAKIDEEMLRELHDEFPLEVNALTRMAAFRVSRDRTGGLGQVDDRLRPITGEVAADENAEAMEQKGLAKKEEG